MTARNGYLPDSALAPIPGGRLSKEAAASWNAMIAAAKGKGLPIPVPDGSESTYRTYEQQVSLKAYWTQQGSPDNAATPGTSNHGWGTAVDCAEDATHHAATIDEVGEPYGWSKKWSDAPWESWHNHYKSGVWAPKIFSPDYKRGSKGLNVLLFTGRLVKLGYLDRRWFHFNLKVESAVKGFQHDHHFTTDGIVGPATWSAIKRLTAAKKRSSRRQARSKKRS